MINADDCGVTPLLAASLNNHVSTCVVLIRDNCLVDVVGDVKLSAGVHNQLTALQACSVIFAISNYALNFSVD